MDSARIGKTKAEYLFDQVVGRPKSPRNYLKDRTNISVKAYSGASRKLPDFRVDSILDKPVKVDEVSTSTLSAASNSRKLASSQRASSRKKTAVPSQPRPLSPPRVTRSRRSKVSSSANSTNNSIKCDEKSKLINRGPRIPFSAEQIQALEEKFNETNYLSSQEVYTLSEELKIPENRVKIWFQNRRARRKRETKSSTDVSQKLEIAEKPERPKPTTIIEVCPNVTTRRNR